MHCLASLKQFHKKNHDNDMSKLCLQCIQISDPHPEWPFLFNKQNVTRYISISQV